MADRTSARLFEIIFKELAKDPTDEHKRIAKKLWPMRLDCDFSTYQMECDAALVKLGLATKHRDHVHYKGEEEECE